MHYDLMPLMNWYCHTMAKFLQWQNCWVTWSYRIEQLHIQFRATNSDELISINISTISWFMTSMICRFVCARICANHKTINKDNHEHNLCLNNVEGWWLGLRMPHVIDINWFLFRLPFASWVIANKDRNK